MTAKIKNYNFVFLRYIAGVDNNYKVEFYSTLLACGVFIVSLTKKNNNFFDAPRPWQMSFQQPATPLMEAIIDLHHNIMTVMIFIVIFISYILLKAVWLFNSKRRGIEEIPKLSKTRHYLPLEVIWTIIPMIILFFIAVPSFALLYSMDNCPKPELTFKVIGRQWYWSYESDFFIQRPIPSFFIEKDNYKLNLNLFFFQYYFIESTKNLYNINYLNSYLKAILHDTLIPALLKNITNVSLNDVPYLFKDNISESYTDVFYYRLLEESGIKKNNIDAYKALLKKFSDYNLDVEDGSTTVSLEALQKSSNFLDFLKYYLVNSTLYFKKEPVPVCLLKEGCTLIIEEGEKRSFFEVISYKASHVCMVIAGVWDLDYAVTRVIDFLHLKEEELCLEPELRRILTVEFTELTNSPVIKDLAKIVKNTTMSCALSMYFALDKSPDFLKVASFFIKLHELTYEFLLSTTEKSKYYDSFVALFNYFVDDQSYPFLKKSLEKDQLAPLPFLKFIIDWHKNLYDTIMIVDKNSFLPYFAKNGNGYVNALIDRGESRIKHSYIKLNELSMYKSEAYLDRFFLENKKLAFAFLYYNNTYTEFSLTDINEVCTLFNLDKTNTNYFKQSLTCNFYYKFIFTSNDYLNPLINSFFIYHKIFPILKNTIKDTLKTFYEYKHISVDFDSCILSDNEVYKIFKELCVNDDILDLDNLPTDFCGWYRLLEVDKRLILPIKTRIRLLVTSSDVLHSWAVPSLGIKIDACPGRLNCVYVYIKRPGVFHGQCSELCGVKHGFMPIVVHGVSKSKFNFWVSSVGEFVPKSSKLINA